MELKPGDKQAEVGVIPEDWMVKPLSELFAFSRGYSASRAQLSNEGHCYLHYGDIHGSSKTTVDTSLDHSDIPKLAISLRSVSRDSLLDDGDVVFVDASEDDEGTSKHIVVVNKACLPFISGLHTIVAKARTGDIDFNYRRYCFQTQAIREQFMFYSVGTKVTGISKSNIRKLFLPLPPVSEQQAIAAALSDVDALLDCLDKLITKKRNLKQAAMQLLLKGKKRLPGFEEEWKVIRLGEIATIRDGTHQTPKYVTSGIPFYSVEHVTSNDFSNTKFISAEEHRFLTRSFKIEKGDILMTRIGSIGNCKLIDWEVEASFYVSLALLKIKPEVSASFIAHYSNSRAFKEETELHSLPSAVPKKINLGPISNITVKLPPKLEEQAAIAAILTDMDAEITALEQRRTKTRDLKQAMMQELLTGKTRLISPVGCNV